MPGVTVAIAPMLPVVARYASSAIPAAIDRMQPVGQVGDMRWPCYLAVEEVWE